ncbi:glycosyltransferase family 2 protein [Methylomarinum sp. Ch1-1]|uniref:Glycosyltransferase family 2 protein n=1 Tax=Methylomarinum roseum TaxID=3067653 RepID=A0AAU7NX24_9GAMM|nr:glycosyltransferase family 2 protein [Methylomarinum sp. Ch1-1]MDP4522381.1 glycosyltransferase family 2 protein [Methylomarinum sp. Ch1-1]
MKTCIVIPVYNHPQAIVQVVERLKAYDLPCYLVNDGSSEACSAILRGIAEQEKGWITLLERPSNGGKGAAVSDGLRRAIADGYSHAVQIDADGQHKLEDLGRFLASSEQHPDSLILGKPRFDATVPKGRLYGRQFTNLWIWINTLSFAIADGMCGFRCYPLAAVEKLLNSARLGRRMDFDIEIAVRLYWQGVDVVNLETEVQYPLDGVSHFQILKDNLLISGKHAQLFFGMLWRLPRLLWRRFR